MRLGNNQGRDNLYEFFYGPLDLIFIVGVVMSFLAIILTYGAIAGEKEQGTLAADPQQPRAAGQDHPGQGGGQLPRPRRPVPPGPGPEPDHPRDPGTALAALGGAWTSLGLAVVLFRPLHRRVLQPRPARFGPDQAGGPGSRSPSSWPGSSSTASTRALGSAAAQVLHPVKSEARLALEKAQIRRNIEKARDAEIDQLLRDADARRTGKARPSRRA